MGIQLDVLNLIIFASFVVVLFYVAQLLFQKKGNFKANLVMSLLLIFIMISISLYGLLINTTLYKMIPHIIKIPTLLVFSFGPLFLIYVQLLMHSARLNLQCMAVHFLPLIIYLMIFLPFFFSSGENKIVFIERWIWGSPDILELVTEMVLIGSGAVHVLIYLAVVLRYLSNLDKKQKRIFSDRKINLSWIIFFIRFGMVSFLLIFCVVMLMLFVDLHLTLIYRIIPVFVSLGLIALSFRALQQSDIKLSVTRQIETQPEIPKSYTNQETQELAQRITAFMINNKPYLDEELTLQKLADTVGTTRNVLSHTINFHFKQNFYDFVNTYRVEEAKRIMNGSGIQSVNFLQIGMDAGFNSKTAFNVNFKKVTGMTPTDFCKKS